MKVAFTFAVLALAVCAFIYVEALIPPYCTLPGDEGENCKDTPPSTRYRFFMNNRTCIELHFKGCEGNANNFLTLDQCERTCGHDPSPGFTTVPPIDPPKPARCTFPITEGKYCTGKTRSTRYGYDLIHRQCVSFSYKGCEGNENNFKKIGDCMSMCERN